jgi:hypothetical protein
VGVIEAKVCEEENVEGMGDHEIMGMEREEAMEGSSTKANVLVKRARTRLKTTK